MSGAPASHSSPAPRAAPGATPAPATPVSSASPAAATSGAPASQGPGTTFYRFHDANGQLVIVDSLSRVPSSARPSVETIVLAPPSETVNFGGLSAQTLDWPSFAAGATCALLLGLVGLGLRRAGTPVLRFALIGGLVVLGAGAYFGWLRRVTGQGESMVSSPATLIDDARSAVESMNARTREQQRILKDLESQR
jgi:hypothetical protein